MSAPRVRAPLCFAVWLTILLVLSTQLRAGVATTTTLAAAPTQITLSQPVSLTAAISPPPATGKVTFYDGTAILGISTVTAGQATLSTLLPFGARSLQARYWGDANFNPSASNLAQVAVSALGSYTFKNIAIPAPGGGPCPNLPGRPPCPYSVVAADFNGDGHLDLAYLSPNSNGVIVLIGDGNGGFTQGKGGTSPTQVSDFALMAAGDFNGDGNLDLAIPDLVGTVNILLGDGNGGFTAAQGIPFASRPLQVVVADFDRDGKPDLAVTTMNDVAVLLGDGRGGFGSASTFPVGQGPFGLAVGDFNSDGVPDLAVANSTGNQVTILLGDGNGGFASTTSFATGFSDSAEPTTLAVADLNLDGKPDLAVVDSYANRVSVLLGDGKGGFAPAGLASVRSTPYTLATGDFDGDGNPDVVVASSYDNSITLLLGDGKGGLSASAQSPFAVPANPSLAVGDFNEDGRLDVAVVSAASSAVTLLLAIGSLSISVAEAGQFSVGQDGIYYLTVSNGLAASTGLVTVIDTLPAGLTPKTATGDGWLCTINQQLVTCTRSDPLAPGGLYPQITLTVAVSGTACTAANNTVQVLSGGSSIHQTKVTGCLAVTQQAGTLIANTTVPFNVTLKPGPSAPNVGNITFTDVLPLGLTPVSVAPVPACQLLGQIVTCLLVPDAQGAYPTIGISVKVDAQACPTALNSIITLVPDGGAPQVFRLGAADLTGCLNITPASLDFQPVAGQLPLKLIIISTDNHPLQVTIPPIPSPAFFATTTCTILNPGESCEITVNAVHVCFGLQTATLTILTNPGNPAFPYSVPISAVGAISTVSFALGGTAVSGNATVQPDTSSTVSLTLTPSPPPYCQQNPTLALSFDKPAPDPAYATWDVQLDSSNTLHTGTVAGFITLKAQINGADLMPLNGSNAVTIQVPALPPVITGVAIANRQGSSFEVDVSAFSTPRDATTQVCFAFLPSSGDDLQVSAPTCALQQDIEIWYERDTSYQYGSQFKGSVAFSFSGDPSAIGIVEVTVKNTVNDKISASAPVCVGFLSNTVQDCPR